MAKRLETEPLRVHLSWSWMILAFLVAWSLATGYFPYNDLSLRPITYWVMAIISVVGLLCSIVLHEICHSLVARRFGLGGKVITLFVFGGVSDIEKEPTNPRAEILIAIAGPVFSFAFGLFLAWIDSYGLSNDWSAPVTDVLYYLSTINYALAVFNLIPAFPLDGGRIFRSLLWAWKGNVEWATKTASRVGSAFAAFLMVAGILNTFAFNFINGIWLFFLGMFLMGLARASYGQVLIAKLMGHESVERLMRKETVCVSPAESLRQLADDIYLYRSKFFPVVEEQKLLGCVELDDLKKFPQDQWDLHRVREVTSSCSPVNVVSPSSDVVEALKIMNRNKRKELLVADQGKFLGVISLKDIMEFFTLKMEIEGTAA